MALVDCPECGKEVSDQAQSCPDCGFPVAQRLTNASPNRAPSRPQTSPAESGSSSDSSGNSLRTPLTILALTVAGATGACCAWLAFVEVGGIPAAIAVMIIAVAFVLMLLTGFFSLV